MKSFLPSTVQKGRDFFSMGHMRRTPLMASPVPLSTENLQPYGDKLVGLQNTSTTKEMKDAVSSRNGARRLFAKTSVKPMEDLGCSHGKTIRSFAEKLAGGGIPKDDPELKAMTEGALLMAKSTAEFAASKGFLSMMPDRCWTRSMSGSPDGTGNRRCTALWRFFLCAASLVFWLNILAGPCRADGGRVAISAQGTDGFVISAINLPGIVSLDISMEYSDASLGSPSVSTTSAFMAETVRKKSDSPGKISISGTVRTNFRERLSGSLAVVRFEQSGDPPGKVYSGKVVATDIGGARREIPVTITNAPEEANKKAKDSQAGSRDAGDVGGDGTGTVPLPAGSEESPMQGSSTNADIPDGSSAPSRVQRTGRSLRHDQPVEFQRREGVLDRFRELTSFTDTDVLEKVFREVRSSEFRQEPSVILSDGRTRATLSLHVYGTAGDGPFFLLKNARCLSVRNPGVHSWELEVLPEPGVYEATVTVRFGSKMIEYPLTVAPYRESRAENAARRAPMTYVDHYIRIANRLAEQKK
ncbi:MAG: hypothetical protein GYA56_07290 [Geobacteraceae bacterium]|nr:hypothetical protein [Geobacteraceae bacterium]